MALLLAGFLFPGSVIAHTRVGRAVDARMVTLSSKHRPSPVVLRVAKVSGLATVVLLPFWMIASQAIGLLRPLSSAMLIVSCATFVGAVCLIFRAGPGEPDERTRETAP